MDDAHEVHEGDLGRTCVNKLTSAAQVVLYKAASMRVRPVVTTTFSIHIG
jgi:hypothetical protein